MQKTAKYKNIKKSCDGYTFDSSIEMKYYEKLKDDKAKGLIDNFELQPVYEIMSKFKSFNKSYRAINYVADFAVYKNDESVEVIDIKGMATETAKIKRKLFLKSYGHILNLKWIVWNKGQWRNFDEVAKERAKNKKLKLEAQNGL